MRRKILNFTGEFPQKFDQAFAELAPLLGLETGETGVLTEVFRAEGLVVKKHGDQIRIGWGKPVHLYRALSLLAGAWEDEDYERTEFPCFTTGMMFDASRNAVPSPEGLKEVFRRMALMGMDVGMMYTEDTYEVPDYPYFGYMRGRYSKEEIRRLDDYADMLGIELIPCIQTLGHLNRILHWPAMYRFGDNGEVLLADSEETYGLLRSMIASATEPYRTCRVHIGMDETHGIGLGAHLGRYGYENPHTIISRHLRRVKEITDELGLRPMMWGDMFFRPDSPTNSYYDTGDPSQASIEGVVPGVEIVYWDYYHNTEEEYTRMIEKHRKLGSMPVFAGGIWTWTGPAPDYEKTVTASVAGLSAAKKAGVKFCIGCAWGDNGAEANILTALPGIQLYAEFAYTGEYDANWLAERFQTCCGGALEPFLRLSKFNTVPGMKPTALRPVNAAKFLLYQDPMVQLFAEDTKGLKMADHYETLAKEYEGYTQNSGRYRPVMEFYTALARVLSGKCRWHEEARDAVLANDKKKVGELAALLGDTRIEAEKLRAAWRSLWNLTNKPYGFEVIDGRMGAVIARLETARFRALSWASGEEGETLSELCETPLPYTRREGGTLFGSYAVEEIVSACKI